MGTSMEQQQRCNPSKKDPKKRVGLIESDRNPKKKITDSNKSSSLYYLGNLESLLYILNVASCFGNNPTTFRWQKTPFFRPTQNQKKSLRLLQLSFQVGQHALPVKRRGLEVWGAPKNGRKFQQSFTGILFHPLLLTVQKSGEKTTWDI